MTDSTPTSYDRDLVAAAGTTITIAGDGHTAPLTVDLYSRRGLEVVASLWLKLSVEHRLMYEPAWLGIPIIQLPGDIVAMQELIWRVRPDLIIECGVAHGGSAIFYASICELVGKGHVIGVDVEIRQYNRVAIENHPMTKRIDLVEGSSTDPAIFDHVARRARTARTVLVVLDSNHTRDHVLQELALYHRLVTPGSYLVAMDGAAAHTWDVPRGDAKWRDDHPLAAIRQFLADHPEFSIDPHYGRHLITSNPDAFLRRSAPDTGHAT